MAALTITLTSTCSGGQHLTIGITGNRTATIPVTLSELIDPITAQDLVAFTSVITKLARTGRTNAQARTLLQGGIVVTV